jgi:hypothetical protein
VKVRRLDPKARQQNAICERLIGWHVLNKLRAIRGPGDPAMKKKLEEAFKLLNALPIK